MNDKEEYRKNECDGEMFLKNFIFGESQEEQLTKDRVARTYGYIFENIRLCPIGKLSESFTHTMLTVEAANNKPNVGIYYRPETRKIYFNTPDFPDSWDGERRQTKLVHELGHAFDFDIGENKSGKCIPVSYLAGVYAAAEHDAERIRQDYNLPARDVFQHRIRNFLFPHPANNAWQKIQNFFRKYVRELDLTTNAIETALISEILSGYYMEFVGTGGHTFEYWKTKKRKHDFEVAYSTEIFANYIVMCYWHYSNHSKCDLTLVYKYCPETMAVLNSIITSL